MSWRTYLATPTRLVERVVVMPNESHSVVANEGAHLQEIRRTLDATSPPAYPHDPERMWAVAAAVIVAILIVIVIVIVVAVVSVIVIANVNGSPVHHHHLQ